jgi:ribonuclease HI
MSQPTETEPSWRRVWFKTHKVWLAIDSNGRPVCRNGKLLIRYQKLQDQQYWVNPENIRELNVDRAESPALPEVPGLKTPPQAPVSASGAVEPADALRIYTDGASSGNPGPAGAGIVLEYGEHVREISRHLGRATNNVAELEAIRIGLEAVKRKNLPVRVYTDSTYAHGVLTLGWKARKNPELVAAIRLLLTAFKDVKLIKVPGHAGHPQNERADRLARMAALAGGGR